MLYFGFRLLVDASPGLVLNEQGLAINDKIGSGGIVRWNDVSGLSLTRYGHDYQLVVNVKRPESYLARGGAIYRLMNSLSAALFGSPVRINAGLLDCNRNDLLRVANEFRARYSGRAD